MATFVWKWGSLALNASQELQRWPGASREPENGAFIALSAGMENSRF